MPTVNENLQDDMQEIKETFAKRLNYLRVNNKLTQEELAYYLDVSRTHITTLERAKSLPSLKVLIRVTKLFKCSFDFLLNKNITADHYTSATNNFFEIIKSADEIYFDDMEVTVEEKDLIISAIKHALSIVQLSEKRKK